MHRIQNPVFLGKCRFEPDHRYHSFSLISFALRVPLIGLEPRHLAHFSMRTAIMRQNKSIYSY